MTNIECSRLAAWIHDNLFQIHRGAFPGSVTRLARLPEFDGIIAFGNDGYATNERTKEAVDLLRRRLSDAGLKEVGFAVSPEGGFTWVIACQVPSNTSQDEAASLVWAMVWESDAVARSQNGRSDASFAGMIDYQRQVATKSLHRLSRSR
jgi:hypothetical protein